MLERSYYSIYQLLICFSSLLLFQSEFIAECFMRRTYIAGFTGSAGTAVVTKDKAAPWTNGRYFLQVTAPVNIIAYTFQPMVHVYFICFVG
jgi:hypothetical protein